MDKTHKNDYSFDMTEAFILIDRQPPRWPRWRNGLVYQDKATGDAELSDYVHMFLLEPIPGVPYPHAGLPVPACRFLGGARYVEIDKSSRPLVLQLCDECAEVCAAHNKEQHGDVLPFL